MIFCDDCAQFINNKCAKLHTIKFKEPVDISSEDWGYYRRGGCKDFEVPRMKSEKEKLLDKLLIGNPDTVANFGALQIPKGFKIMRLEGRKNDPKQPIYYFIKYTGEYSIPTTRKQVFEWIKENRKHHGEI